MLKIFLQAQKLFDLSKTSNKSLTLCEFTYIIITSLYVEVVFLKWSKSQLARLDIPNFTFHESIVLDSNFIESIPNLLDLKDIVLEGKGHYLDELDTLRLEFTIKGIMVVPCARSLEPVDYHFESVNEAEYSFSESQNEECIIVKNNIIDTTELIKEIISLEVPIRVIKEGAELKKSGKGWEVKGENEVGIDPRFEKLKELFK